jgi:hypothetical protein
MTGEILAHSFKTSMLYKNTVLNDRECILTLSPARMNQVIAENLLMVEN